MFWNRLLVSLVAGATLSSAFLLPAAPNDGRSQQFVRVAGTRDPSLEDLDETRRQLESLVHPSVFPPTLTSGARRRLELEIQLLESLVDSDEPVDHLMNLWIHECPTANREIEVIRYLETECPEGAEGVLRGMVNAYPEWPEPAARLAFLVGLKERSVEAQTYADAVLAQKPWHFEVQHMQVLFCLQQKDIPRAIRCARRRLPPVSCPKRRTAWVERSVELARQQLERLDRIPQEPPPSQSSAWQ